MFRIGSQPDSCELAAAVAVTAAAAVPVHPPPAVQKSTIIPYTLLDRITSVI